MRIQRLQLTKSRIHVVDIQTGKHFDSSTSSTPEATAYRSHRIGIAQKVLRTTLTSAPTILHPSTYSAPTHRDRGLAEVKRPWKHCSIPTCRCRTRVAVVVVVCRLSFYCKTTHRCSMHVSQAFSFACDAFSLMLSLGSWW